jgi:hypothetical protein
MPTADSKRRSRDQSQHPRRARARLESNQLTYDKRLFFVDIKARYGAGLTYVYFFGDTVAKGWNLGITPTVGKKYEDYRGGPLINVGYQF